MKNILLFLLIIFANDVLAQPLKKITKTIGDQFWKINQVYFVLDEDQTMRHGSYEESRNGNKLVQGFYKMDQKDSVWKYYAPRAVFVAEKNYKDGQKTGVWKFYTGSGVEWQYDFSNKTGTPPKHMPTAKTYLNENGEWVNEPDVEGYWLHSSYQWQSFLNRTLRYPQDAIDQNAQGTSTVEVTIDEEGNATEYGIAKPNNPALDKEALRIVKIFEPEFSPAEKNGKKVKSKIIIPIVFRIG